MNDSDPSIDAYRNLLSRSYESHSTGLGVCLGGATVSLTLAIVSYFNFPAPAAIAPFPITIIWIVFLSRAILLRRRAKRVLNAIIAAGTREG